MKSRCLSVQTALLVAVLATTVSSAQAELVYSPYFASANVAGDIGSPAALPVKQARTDFLDMVTGVKTETLEGIAAGTSASGAKLFGGSVTIVPPATGEITNVTDNGSGATGRFNTTAGCDLATACNFLETAYNFTLDFGGNYSAFAFFGTDFSDFNGSIYLDLLERDSSGNLVTVAGTHILISGPVGSGALVLVDGTGDGSLLHFGLTDNARAYAGVSFSVLQTATDPINYDYLGFDDLALGTFAGAPVPEPATLALVALSLAGLAASRRKAQPKR